MGTAEGEAEAMAWLLSLSGEAAVDA